MYMTMIGRLLTKRCERATTFVHINTHALWKSSKKIPCYTNQVDYISDGQKNLSGPQGQIFIPGAKIVTF